MNEATNPIFIKYKPILQQVKSLVDKSPVKDRLKVLVKKFNGEYLLELRAYGLPMGSLHGDVEIEDEFGTLIDQIQNLGVDIIEIDESTVSGKQFKYALFALPSGKTN